MERKYQSATCIYKKIWRWSIALVIIINFSAEIQSQEENFLPANDRQADGYNSIQNREAATLAKQILIVDSPGKNGKEVGDTTIFVNNELRLYAAMYVNKRYNGEAKVDWFWADTSKAFDSPSDTSLFLGNGSSIVFKPAKSGTGFIFVHDLPNASGDTTGVIRIIYSEKLIISPALSMHETITQGQQNILVSFRAENTGNFPSRVQEASLQFINADSQIITNQHAVHRIDTATVIPSGETRQFEFLVDAQSNADTGLVLIDAQLMTGETFYSNIEPKHRWQVQTPPLLNIDLIDALVEEVYPGQEDIFVVMQVSNNGGASVGDLNASLTFWRNGQDVSNEYESAMSENNPQFITGDSSAQINLTVRAKPTATYGTIVINGKISAQDVNTAIWYSDEGADLQASWLVKQTTSAQVGIIATRIICPNGDANGNGQVNVDQNYVVEVIIRNQGTETVQTIGVTLNSDGNSLFLSDPTQVIASLVQSQTATVTYQFVALADTIPALENFVAQIDSATSAGGAQVTINAAFDSLAQVKILYPANLILKIEPEFVEIPVGGAFDVIATVDHSPVNAGFDSTGKLSIMLPQGCQLISGNLTRSFKENENVTWKVRSTMLPGGPDTILVYIHQVPHDKNNPDQLALVSVGSAFLRVETMEVFVNVEDVAIIDPEGARDDTISTDQYFRVRARITSQLVENISGKILLPANFSIDDYLEKPIQTNSVTWLLRSRDPRLTKNEKIIVQAWGNVENDTSKVFSQLDSSLSIFIVPRANLKVAAEIINPPSALQGRISPGMLFQIRGEILNSGGAGVYGSQSLFIDVQDNTNFTVIGDTLLSVKNEPAIWTVQASDKIDAIPKIIKVRIHDIPYDENSDEEAFIGIENQVDDVQVYTTVTNIPLMIRQLPEIAPKAIAPGITATMMGIEFANLSSESEFPIQIKALKFDIEDNSGNRMSPQSAIAGFRIRSDESGIGEATQLIDNPIEIPLTNPIVLSRQGKSQAFIEIDFHENLSHSFQINLRDTSSIMIESVGQVLIVDELKNPQTTLNLRSHYPVIAANDLQRSFRNYPNPFGTPDRKKTHFIYYLSQDCDVDLKIYTLIGELVWSCSYRSSDPQGRKGLHLENEITWNAKNSRGNYVLNGVYIARIATSYGESALTKIAVIK